MSVDDVVRVCPLEPFRTDRKGEPSRIKSKGPESQSGAHFLVSPREFNDLAGQIAEAIAYLETNKAAIRDLMAFAGVEGAVLDFGTEWRDVAAQFDRFPAKLLQLAGNLGLDLEISHYPGAEPDAAEVAGA